MNSIPGQAVWGEGGGAGEERTEEASCWEPWWMWPPLATHPSHPGDASLGFSFSQTQVHPQCYHLQFAFELEYPFSLLCFGNPYPPLKDGLFGGCPGYPSFVLSWHFVWACVQYDSVISRPRLWAHWGQARSRHSFVHSQSLSQYFSHTSTLC